VFKRWLGKIDDVFRRAFPAVFLVLAGYAFIMVKPSSRLGAITGSVVLDAFVLGILGVVLVLGLTWSLYTKSSKGAGILANLWLYLEMTIFIFTLMYWELGATDTSAFLINGSAGSLTKLDAVYFTMTTLSTTGFGDIVPHSEPARFLVTCQMIVTVLLLSDIIAGLISRYFSKSDT